MKVYKIGRGRSLLTEDNEWVVGRVITQGFSVDVLMDRASRLNLSIVFDGYEYIKTIIGKKLTKVGAAREAHKFSREVWRELGL